MRWACWIAAVSVVAAAGCRGHQNAALLDEEGRPLVVNIGSIAVLPFFERGDRPEGCRALEREVARALGAKRKFGVVPADTSFRVLQDRAMVSDLLRFQSEFRRHGGFEHSLIEANAALGVSHLLLGEVLAYQALKDPSGGYSASVGATLVLLDPMTNVVWQVSKNESAKGDSPQDLTALAAHVADELVDGLPE